MIESPLKLQLYVYFNKWGTEDLEIMEDAFAEKYFNNNKLIELKHPTAYKFREQNEKVHNWIEVIREIRLERHGFNTD